MWGQGAVTQPPAMDEDETPARRLQHSPRPHALPCPHALHGEQTTKTQQQTTKKHSKQQKHRHDPRMWQGEESWSINSESLRSHTMPSCPSHSAFRSHKRFWLPGHRFSTAAPPGAAACSDGSFATGTWTTTCWNGFQWRNPPLASPHPQTDS